MYGEELPHTLCLLLSNLAIAAGAVEVVSDTNSGSATDNEGCSRSRHGCFFLISFCFWGSSRNVGSRITSSFNYLAAWCDVELLGLDWWVILYGEK